MTKPKHELDWTEFVVAVGRDHSAGKSDEQISSAYGNSVVAWSGKIKRLKLDNESTPGIEFAMPEQVVVLAGGRFIKANYLFLSVDADKKELWTGYAEGNEVLFEATIRAETAISPGIMVGLDDVDDEAILLIAAAGGKPKRG